MVIWHIFRENSILTNLVEINWGQHGKVAYAQVYAMLQDDGEGKMIPIALTSDVEVAEAYLDGEDPYKDEGVIRVMSLPYDKEEESA